jgi:aspartate ammonia-lyase
VPIVKTLLGSTIDLRFVHELNTDPPIVVIDALLLNTTDESFVHLSNALLPIAVTLEGITTDTRLLHS